MGHAHELTALLASVALTLGGLSVADAQGPTDSSPPQIDAGSAQPDAAGQPEAPKPPIEGELSLAQTFRIDAAPNASGEPVATVGTRLVLTLKIVHPANATVALPDRQKTGRFELLGVEREPVAPRGPDSVLETLRVILASYRPGRHTLAPLELTVLDAEGHMSKLSTEPVEVIIQSVMANDNEVAMPEVKPPLPVWHEDWTLVWIFGSLLSLLVSGLVGAFVYRRLNPPLPPPPPPPRPAYDVAIEKLVAIKSAELIEDELFEEHTVRVSEAVREYLGRRYNLSLTNRQGLELTTEELIESVRDVRWPAELGGSFVEAFLYDCDLVKFARHTPSAVESEELLTSAFKLVELTRPTPLGEAATAESGGDPDADGADSTDARDDIEEAGAREPDRDEPQPEEDSP